MKNQSVEEKVNIEHLKAKLAYSHLKQLKLQRQMENITKERDMLKRVLEEIIYKNVTIDIDSIY